MSEPFRTGGLPHILPRVRKENNEPHRNLRHLHHRSYHPQRTDRLKLAPRHRRTTRTLCHRTPPLHQRTSMNPIITDKDTGKELWRVKECAQHCGIKPSTWTTYAAQGRTPAPVTEFDKRTPLWFADEVKDWHANRPGSPVTNHPTAKKA